MRRVLTSEKPLDRRLDRVLTERYLGDPEALAQCRSARSTRAALVAHLEEQAARFWRTSTARRAATATTPAARPAATATARAAPLRRAPQAPPGRRRRDRRLQRRLDRVPPARAGRRTAKASSHSVDLPEIAGEDYEPGHVLGREGRRRRPAGEEPGWMVPRAPPRPLAPRPRPQPGRAPGLLDRLGTIDFFMHDSEHSEACMRFEFDAAWAALRDGGVLAADDVTANGAFATFAAARAPRADRDRPQARADRQVTLTVVVTASGAPGTAALLRALRENGEREVRLVGTDMSDQAVGRHLCDAFHLVPRGSDPAFADAVLEVGPPRGRRRRPAAVLLRPARPRGRARALRRRRRRRPRRRRRRPCAARTTRPRRYAMLDAIGVRGPAWRRVRGVDAVAAAAHELGYPDEELALKPVFSSGSRGFRILSASADRREQLLTNRPGVAEAMRLEDLLDVLGADDEHRAPRHGARDRQGAHDRRHRLRRPRPARPSEDARGDARRPRDVLRDARRPRPDGDAPRGSSPSSSSTTSSTSSSSASM